MSSGAANEIDAAGHNSVEEEPLDGRASANAVWGGSESGQEESSLYPMMSWPGRRARQDQPPPDALADRGNVSPVLGGLKKDAQRGTVVGESALLLGRQLTPPELASTNQFLLSEKRNTFALLTERLTKKNISNTDLKNVREYVMSEVADRFQSTLANTSHMGETLRDDVKTLRTELFIELDRAEEVRRQGSAADRSYTLEVAKDLQEEINQSREYLKDQMRNCFAAIRRELYEYQVQSELNRQNLACAFVNNLTRQAAATAVLRATTVALLEQQRLDFEACLQERAEALSAEIKEHARAAGDADEAVKSILCQSSKELEMKILERTEGFTDLAKNLQRTMLEFKERVEESAANTDQSIRESLENLHGESNRRLKATEVEHRRLAKAVSEVENLSTRRVEWTIKNATALLARCTSAQGQRWLSPMFDAGGAHGLQLELRTYSSDDLNNGYSEEVDHMTGIVGDCAILLWSESFNLQLICKLFIGEMSQEVQHIFDGTGPCIAKRTGCILRDQISQQDDTLCIGVEILETVRKIQQLNRPIEASVGPGGPADLLDGTFSLHRHLNHRTLELVQGQVDRMQSRMVRRIEWRLEQASLLPRCFPQGESLCSTPFEAAGLGEMQLVFYPSGYAGAKEGFCSLFLSCPGGSALRCWLSAGKQRREAKLAFEQSGFFGRTNFCRYDSCAEASEDCILIALEIDEAQQDVTEVLWHKPPQSCVSVVSVAKTERTDRQGGERPKSRPVTVSPPPGCAGDALDSQMNVPFIESSMKLRREPGRHGLQDVRQLPSIWTSRPPGDIDLALEGFHSFADLKAKRPVPPGSRSSNRPSHAFQVAARYTMYAQ